MSALDGVRLVTLALNVPGPVAVARLVAEGASACKFEPPSGDPLAVYSREWYQALHAGVEVHRADLKTEQGRRRVDVRLAEADVLVTSHRPSSLARLGLSPEALRARHPALRAVAIVGDTTAPDVPGHDLTYQAEAGLLDDGMPATLLADLVGAEHAVAAVLLVLREEPGARRVVGLRDALDGLIAPRRHRLTTRQGRLGGADPAYRVYRTRDGFVAVAALEPHFRARLYAALGQPVDSPIEPVFATRTSAEWRWFADTHDVPIAVLSPSP